MNKREFIDALAVKTGATKKDTDIVVGAFLDTIQEGLMEDGKVAFAGFGSFEVVERGSRKGRNPQTGEEIVIPAKKAVKFKPMSALKELVNS